MALARRMRPLPISRLKVTSPFWARWQRLLVTTTLPHEHAQIEATGRLENFRRAARGETGGFAGLPFDDSDVYKWAEACAYALATHPNDALRKLLDEAIDTVAAAQMPNGYLDTYIQIEHPGGQWKNLNSLHEMYCAGHLVEAAVAISENLGDQRLLGVATRFADHIMSVFGPDKRLGYCGHEELELALVRLAAHTGDAKYREFSRWMVEARGSRPSPFEIELQDSSSVALSPWGKGSLYEEPYSGEYCQDHAPIREHDTVVGHAVRAMYLYIAAADLADGHDDEDLEAALQKTWDSLVKRRMYVTGGIGPSARNEGFTADYDLPNLSAYAETCAAIGLCLWGQKMLEMTGNGEFAETVERALYNGVLSGISLSGDRFFYDNPLESRGQHERKPWFHCACCPPNIARLIGNVGAMLAGESEKAFYLHNFAGFEADTVLNGVPVRIEVASDYPFSGPITVRVDPKSPVQFTLYVRIPEWAEDVSTDLPTAEEEADFDQGYAIFERVWSPGDVLTIDLGAIPTWVEADPRVRENLGRTALTHGPLVYCLEEKDLGCAPQLFVADTQAPIEPRKDSRLEGIEILPVEGTVDVETFPDTLYAPLGSGETRSVTADFVPYYAWNNRGPNGMQVWVRRL